VTVNAKEERGRDAKTMNGILPIEDLIWMFYILVGIGWNVNRRIP